MAQQSRFFNTVAISRCLVYKIHDVRSFVKTNLYSHGSLHCVYEWAPLNSLLKTNLFRDDVCHLGHGRSVANRWRPASFHQRRQLNRPFWVNDWSCSLFVNELWKTLDCQAVKWRLECKNLVQEQTIRIYVGRFVARPGKCHFWCHETHASCEWSHVVASILISLQRIEFLCQAEIKEHNVPYSRYSIEAISCDMCQTKKPDRTYPLR